MRDTNKEWDKCSNDESEHRSLAYMKRQMVRRLDMRARASRKKEKEEDNRVKNHRKPGRHPPAGGAPEANADSSSEDAEVQPPPEPDPGAAARPPEG